MRTTMTSLRKGLLAVALVTPLLLALPSNISAQALKITTSSDPADLVSGAGALLRVDARAHVPTNDFVMEVNGPNVTGTFLADQTVRTLADLATNQQRGPNRHRAPGRPPNQRIVPPPPTSACPTIIKPGYNLNETVLLNQGWVKAFEDNFSCPPLDPNKWTYWTSGAYNEELQCYQLANLNIINADLQIKAIEEPINCDTDPGDSTSKAFDYTSGRIESIPDFLGSGRAVRIYARMKLPFDYGLWPAFWTLGDHWPTNGEIDIMEAKVDVAGQVPNEYQTNYFYGEEDSVLLTDPAATAYPVTGVDLTSQYHVFMVEWTATDLKFYYDGVLKEIKTSTGPGSPGEYIPDLWSKRQRIVLNLAYGGEFFAANFVPGPITDGIMKVDWVKVFKKFYVGGQ